MTIVACCLFCVLRFRFRSFSFPSLSPLFVGSGPHSAALQCVCFPCLSSCSFPSISSHWNLCAVGGKGGEISIWQIQQETTETSKQQQQTQHETQALEIQEKEPEDNNKAITEATT